jgi:geranylgeranyl diphosphate synthase type II
MKRTGDFDLKTYAGTGRERVDAALESYLPPEDAEPRALHSAMRYSVYSGGKRIRPLFCIAGFEACGGSGDAVLPVACAIELIHTYSLIHDDLPCMDDDDMRRGKPTSHKVFGEAVALLAGDALLTLAFEVVGTAAARGLAPETASAVALDLAAAAGSRGMVAGQVLDMEYENKDAGEGTVELIHSLKTGRLITSAVRCGALVASAEARLVDALTVYGSKVGLAFQIVDDILDEEGGFGDLKTGKGRDGARGKATYPGVLGLEKSKTAARRLADDAAAALDGLGPGFTPLVALARFVVSRIC